MAWVIGVDEVGRGPLAGPVVVGGVLVERPTRDAEWPVKGVRDSKKLSPAKRLILAQQLAGHPAVHHTFARKSAHEIDNLGIVPALGHCFRECIATLMQEAQGRKVEAILVDGDPLWSPHFLVGANGPPVRFIRQGDSKEWSIGAASILAKTHRDEFMVRLAEQHPGYGWERNSGYGTSEHEEAIRRQGLSPHHRRTFCRKFVGADTDVLEMFGS